MDLNGKTVVIVGGGSGIGRAIAERASARGARLVLVGRGRERLEAAAAALPGPAEAIVADVTDEDQVAALFERLGTFDHLLSTANRSAGGRVTDLAVADVSEAFGAKLLAPLLLAKHGSPRIAADGSITFFSGYVAWRPAPGGTVQALVNGGLAAFAQALAVELAPVRVNAIAPGLVDSGAWDGMEESARERLFAGYAERAPAGRVGDPGDVAELALLAMTNRALDAAVVLADGGARFG